MRKTQKLRFTNAMIWIAAITACLFVIGFVARIGAEWSKTPIDRIGTNNFRFHVSDSQQYFIYFKCDNEVITASYDLSEKSFRSYPTEIDLLDKAVRWTAVHNGEVFSASMAAPFVLSGKEAFKQFNSYNGKRLNNIRLFRKALRNRWVLMAVLSVGGYWGGDFAAAQLDVPCQRSKDLNWLKTVDWKALTRAIYDHRAHEVGGCVNSLGRSLKLTENPTLQELKAKYFGAEDDLLSRLTMSMNRSAMLREIIEIFPSPSMTSFLPDDDFAIAIDFMYDVGEEELHSISTALDECRRITKFL